MTAFTKHSDRVLEAVWKPLPNRRRLGTAQIILSKVKTTPTLFTTHADKCKKEPKVVIHGASFPTTKTLRILGVLPN